MIVSMTTIGIIIALITLTVIVWSIVFPDRRIWPPKSYTRLTPIMVWVPTFTLFGSLILVGILEWGTWAIPPSVRFGLGGLLIVSGNIGVWMEVAKFGIDQTGGASGELRTGGLYRYSRNPQYVSDMVIVLGWMLMSASPSALLIGAASIAVLAVAPFSEEPWLIERYGKDYQSYKSRVRRFL